MKIPEDIKNQMKNLTEEQKILSEIGTALFFDKTLLKDHANKLIFYVNKKLEEGGVIPPCHIALRK